MQNTRTEYSSDQRMSVVLLEMEQLLPPLSAEQFSASVNGTEEQGFANSQNLTFLQKLEMW